MRLFFILLFLLCSNSFAQSCKVYGISDSPQKLHCSLKNASPLDLICVDGNYLIKWNSQVFPVTIAFHMEVEEGPNPLVFQDDEIKLTVVGKSAELVAFHSLYSGNCK